MTPTEVQIEAERIFQHVTSVVGDGPIPPRYGLKASDLVMDFPKANAPEVVDLTQYVTRIAIDHIEERVDSRSAFGATLSLPTRTRTVFRLDLTLKDTILRLPTGKTTFRVGTTKFVGFVLSCEPGPYSGRVEVEVLEARHEAP